MKKFAQTQTPQQQSFFVFAQTQHQQASLFCIFFSHEWSTGEGGFKNPKQHKSLLVLALLANQNAIGAGDTLQPLHIADCSLGNSLCWPAPRNCAPLNSPVKLASPSSCKTPLKLATPLSGVASRRKTPIRAAICMVST